jgi:hypothetical protein
MSRQKVDDKRKEQQALLSELESIKSLLDDEIDADAIPLLQEMVIEESWNQAAHVAETDDELSALAAETPTKAPSVLPGQQSLFKEKIASALSSTGIQANSSPKKLTQHSIEKPTVVAKGENPFLPQHIRARLNGNTLLPAFDTDNNPVFNAPLIGEPIQETNVAQEAMNHKRIIDTLVAEFLPKIESELRRRLQAELQQGDPFKNK